MSIRNAFRLLLPCFFAVLWSSSALATESVPAAPASSLCFHADRDAGQLPDTRLTQLAFINSDEDPGNLDDPGPDALVPRCYFPTLIKATVNLSREQRSVPFKGQASAPALRGPPLPL